jgi:hypothetical protein
LKGAQKLLPLKVPDILEDLKEQAFKVRHRK